MKSDEILILLKEIFGDHEIVEGHYKKYNISHPIFYLKRNISKFKSKLKIGELKQLVVGTTTFENCWELVFFFHNQDFTFRIESEFERQSLEIIKDWYDEYRKVTDAKNILMTKYSRIRKNFKEELRDHQLNKLL
jgi:hypothetical protein